MRVNNFPRLLRDSVIARSRTGDLSIASPLHQHATPAKCDKNELVDKPVKHDVPESDRQASRWSVCLRLILLLLSRRQVRQVNWRSRVESRRPTAARCSLLREDETLTSKDETPVLQQFQRAMPRQRDIWLYLCVHQNNTINTLYTLKFQSSDSKLDVHCRTSCS